MPKAGERRCGKPGCERLREQLAILLIFQKFKKISIQRHGLGFLPVGFLKFKEAAGVFRQQVKKTHRVI